MTTKRRNAEKINKLVYIIGTRDIAFTLILTLFRQTLYQKKNSDYRLISSISFTLTIRL